MSGPGYDYAGTVLTHVNGVLERRSVPFRLDDHLHCVFVGDEAAHELVVEPALDALSDARLAGARDEFEDALSKLRRGTPKDPEDAIEEPQGRRERHEGRPRQPRLQLPANPACTKNLHDALVAGGIIEQESDNLVRAAARVANAMASHGAGSVVRATPPDLAAALVAVAAAAIVFLAGRMSPAP